MLIFIGVFKLFACIVRPYDIYSSMAHFHIKTKKGRPYLYVREIARVNGRPKVISQVYLGSPERLVEMARSSPDSSELKLKAEEFGALWLASHPDHDIDLVGLIDTIVPRHPSESGPSIGEYFLYCVWNRMVHPVSKNKLSAWYARTAIQQIRPVDHHELTSQRYWEKWDRVSEKHINQIAQRFFERLWQVEKPEADCMLFDTTNYYTFMASETASQLAMRGKNKAGRHYLRQIGLGLLVARKSRLPLYYRVYEGNEHDSRLFQQIMDEMFGIVCGFAATKERLTVVFDKGMNAEGNFAWIDNNQRIHFITNYSTYFAEDLVAIPLERFEPVATRKNIALADAGNEEERVLTYRTSGEYWGKERAVVVTFNPASARKQNYTFDSKLEALREELLEMRAKAREQAPQWRDTDKIMERYLRTCERLHIASNFYTIEFSDKRSATTMSFSKDVYQVEKKRQSFGKNVIITDNTDWSTVDIVQANLDRWEVENQFRLSKNDDCVAVSPFRHWTDSKIRCHLFTCVAAMTYLRRIELKLQSHGMNRTAEDVMEDMSQLHSIMVIRDGRSEPKRKLEEPTKTQAEVLSVFGYRVDAGGVLQPITQ
jgi:transposase